MSISATQRRRIRALSVETLEDRRMLATITVTSLSDGTLGSLAGDGNVSLREAIHAANTNTSVDGSASGISGFDRIVFQAGLNGTVMLQGGEFSVEEALEIQGNGNPQSQINAHNDSRIFNVVSTDLTLDGLWLRNGRTTGTGESGGAINAVGNVTIRNSRVSGSETHGDMAAGGAIAVSLGTLAIRDSIISDNATRGSASNGGAMFCNLDVNVYDSDVSNNLTVGDGSYGGAITGRDVSIEGSSITGNQTRGLSAAGGGVSAAGELHVTALSTVSGNHTRGQFAGGGGLFAGGRILLRETQVTGNHTRGDYARGGGVSGQAEVWVYDNTSVSGNETRGEYAPGGGVAGNNLVVRNSIVSGNETSGDFSPGGGLSAHRTDVVLSTVSGNQTLGEASSGGGVVSNYLAVRSATVSDNSTDGRFAVGGGIFAGFENTPYTSPYHRIEILDSTISGNSTDGNFAPGGGIYTRDKLHVTNSTVSGNRTHGTDSHGGGIMPADSEDLYLIVRYSTIVGNTAAVGGSLAGGIRSDAGGELLIISSIVANNVAAGGGPDVFGSLLGDTLDSLIGDNGGTDLAETSTANGNIVGGPVGGAVDPLLGPLANNGGTTETHASSLMSPARDRGKANFTAFDQRGLGYPRILDGNFDGVAEADMGSYEHRFTLTNLQVVLTQITAFLWGDAELDDIVDYNLNTGQWSMYFDGSDVGLGGVGLAASFMDDDGSILMSVAQPVTLPGLGLVQNTDVVRFVPTSLGENTQGAFEIVIEGDAFGLTGSEAAIDAIGRNMDGELLLSTTGDLVLTGVGDVANEDLLVLDAGGMWMYFDGSDVGLNGSDNITGLWMEPGTGIMTLAMEGPFDVGGVSGQATNLLAFVPNTLGANTSGAFHVFDAGNLGLPDGTSFNGLQLVETDNLPPDGDFNDDGLYDCLDIDALVAEIAAGTYSGVYDLNLDGVIDLKDRDVWLLEAGSVNLGSLRAYVPGDANLDGFVNGPDFVVWNQHKFTSGAGWCGGDFNADGFTNGQDFVIWNVQKFTSSFQLNTIGQLREPHHRADGSGLEKPSGAPAQDCIRLPIRSTHETQRAFRVFEPVGRQVERESSFDGHLREAEARLRAALMSTRQPEAPIGKRW